MGPEVTDYNKLLILLSVIRLSGGHCTSVVTIKLKSFFIVINVMNMYDIKSKLKNKKSPIVRKCLMPLADEEVS